MNPADIAASGLASPAMEVSSGMFCWPFRGRSALGLLGASVWCWRSSSTNVAIFQTSGHGTVRGGFLVGASLLDELYDLIVAPGVSMAALFVAAMRNGGVRQGAASTFMACRRAREILDVSIAREVEKLESAFWCWRRWPGRSFIGLFGTVGASRRVSLDRGVAIFRLRSSRRHSGGAFRDGDWALRGDSSPDRLQQVQGDVARNRRGLRVSRMSFPRFVASIDQRTVGTGRPDHCGPKKPAFSRREFEIMRWRFEHGHVGHCGGIRARAAWRTAIALWPRST